MATRTVRLDDDSEEILDRLEAEGRLARLAFEIYQELDLEPGGYAIAPSDEAREGVLAALRRKHAR